jgi:hypothetical protein
MAVPNTFATRTTPIPLSLLDADFAYYDAAFSISGINITFAGAITVTGGTANGVAYLNGSKVLTTGSALTFDGTNFGVGQASPIAKLDVLGGNARVALGAGSSATFRGYEIASATTVFASIKAESSGGELRVESGFSGFGGFSTFYTNGSEQMRLTSTGLGIGTSSPGNKLHVNGSGDIVRFTNGSNSAYFALDSAGFTLFTGAGQTGNGLYAKASDNSLQLWTNSSAKAYLDSAGNLGLGVTPSASAILDAQSTTKGVRFPNMTTTQKNAISSPATGLMVFDTTLAKLCVYSGAAWQTITSI